MNLKQKINLLEKLKEERDTKKQKIRFGVKSRWNGNSTSFFRNLKMASFDKKHRKCNKFYNKRAIKINLYR